MTAALAVRDERDLVRKMFSRYLNNERKYDAWGAQGKLLVLMEILAEEGFDPKQLAGIGVQFQKLVNIVFPRTFFSYNKKEHFPDAAEEVSEYYKEVLFQLSLQGVNESMLIPMAVEECSSRFAIDPEHVKEILNMNIIDEHD